MSPALDSDLRFALEKRPDEDIARRCLVYVHKVVNAKGEREKKTMSNQLQPETEVRVMCISSLHGVRFDMRSIKESESLMKRNN